MQGSDPFQRFASAGLQTLGIEFDEAEMAVLGYADGIYRPHIDALMDADLDMVRPEVGIDLGSPPRE